MKRFALALCLIIALATGSASPVLAGDSTLLGTGMGAALGGYLGSTIGKGSGQLAATGAGVFLGGAIGNSIGRSMDRANSSYYSSYPYSPYYQTYSPYQPTYVAPPAAPPPQVIYVQPEVVDYYTPHRSVYVEEGYVGPQPPKPSRHCREFTQTIKIDGRVRESYGTACLRPDGSWQIVQ